MTEIMNRKIIGKKSMKLKIGFFEKKNKIEKPLARLSKKEFK